MAELESPPRKQQKRIEYADVTSVVEESEGYSATVHGMVTSVSPMKGKSATKFFDGYVTDGATKLRFVGFNVDKAKQLEQHANDNETVELANCRIKHALHGNQLEIIVGDRTDISKSALTFEVEDTDINVAEPETKSIKLSELQDLPPYQKIETSAKIIEMDEIVTLDDGRRVQNAVISDSTGRANLSLWEESITLVELDKCYTFSNLIVKPFNEHNTLFTPKSGLTVDSIDNMDALPLLESIKKSKNLTNAQVIAVTKFSSGHACLNCIKFKLDSLEDDPNLGKCPDCHSTVLLRSCTFHVTALLHVTANGFRFQLFASGANLSAIAEKELEEVTELALLRAPMFNATYSTTNMTITNITRSVRCSSH